jgi:hypothetical protein
MVTDVIPPGFLLLILMPLVSIMVLSATERGRLFGACN